MFGGWGIYSQDLMFALMIEEVLYLKANAQSVQTWLAAGAQPFMYQARGKTVKINYYTPPEEAFESAAQMQPWARLALQAALQDANDRVRTPKKTPRRRSATPPA
jgi:DNA transformation protein